MTNLPFVPANRASSRSIAGCVLTGVTLAVLTMLLVGVAGLIAWSLARPQIAAAPSVEITTPANGSQADLNAPLRVTANTTTSAEINRLELWQGGQMVSGLGLTGEQDLTEYQAMFQWMPPAPGAYTLEVRAYGPANDLNALAMVAVNVVDTNLPSLTSPVATPSATPTATLPPPTATSAPTATPIPPTDTPVPPPAPPAAAATAPAQAGPGGSQPGGPGGPLPPEAITACSGLAEGNTCTAASPMGEMTGTCVTIESQLACLPAGGPPGGRPSEGQ